MGIIHVRSTLYKYRNPSFWRIWHDLPPLLESFPPYSTHTLLHPFSHTVPVYVLHFPHIALQLRIPPILGRLEDARTHFAVRGRW